MVQLYDCVPDSGYTISLRDSQLQLAGSFLMICLPFVFLCAPSGLYKLVHSCQGWLASKVGGGLALVLTLQAVDEFHEFPNVQL